MISFIYPYRNRDFHRLINSFESLRGQSVSAFEVLLVDYGSDREIAGGAKALCEKYGFKYIYCYSQFQPWNKSRAINTAVKRLNTDFCFITDVDIVFHPDFVKEALQHRDENRIVYYQVGFLEKDEKDFSNFFSGVKKIRRSTSEATGLSLFPVNALQQIRGFDEFYHFWGAEDTDVHIRLGNAGYNIEFYDDRLLLIHQWHSSFRSSEKNVLTQNLQVRGIVQINHQHLKQAISNKITRVNPGPWGECPGENDMRILKDAAFSYFLTNEKNSIEEFLYGQLPQVTAEILKIRITKDPYEGTLKYRLKKMLGKKVPQYYTLKEVNDIFLLHLIAFYREQPYYYRINKELDEIEIAISKKSKGCTLFQK